MFSCECMFSILEPGKICLNKGRTIDYSVDNIGFMCTEMNFSFSVFMLYIFTCQPLNDSSQYLDKITTYTQLSNLSIFHSENPVSLKQ